MTNKEIIQATVLSAHNGVNYIVETKDFISGAWYMLEYLKKQGMLRFENVGDSSAIYKILADEGSEIYKSKTNV